MQNAGIVLNAFQFFRHMQKLFDAGSGQVSIQVK
jgi:hypothetical protein